MRYVSTLNPRRVLEQDMVKSWAQAPDGGAIRPAELPRLTAFERSDLLQMPFRACFCRTLSLFLPIGALERVLDFSLPEPALLHNRFALFSLFDPASGSGETFVRRTLRRLGCREDTPGTWPWAAVHIALLFGLYAESVRHGLVKPGEPVCLGAEDGDFSITAAAVYARSMGLPLEMTVLACPEDGSAALWELLHRGKLPKVIGQNLTLALNLSLGEEGYRRLASSLESDIRLYLPQDQRNLLKENLFAAVVSRDAASNMIRQLYRTEHVLVSPPAAAAYIAAGQYRAGARGQTPVLLLHRESPMLWGEAVLDAMHIAKQDVLIQIETLTQAAAAEREGL